MAQHEFTTIVVCDAGPLIHLDELRSLVLLSDFTEVCVPEAVWREVQHHRPSALRRRLVHLNRVDIIPEAPAEFVSLIRAFSLDAGEDEALRLMRQFSDATLLTDDTAARLVAQQLGYEVHGTIGVLLRALRRGQRTRRQVLGLLRSLPRRSTLHIDKTLLNSVIAQVQEGRP